MKGAVFVLLGMVIGWWAHGVYGPKDPRIILAAPDVKSTISLVAPVAMPDEKPEDIRSVLRIEPRLLSNPQFVELIALFKLEMSQAEKELLDNELVRYAKKLANTGRERSPGVEEQLLTLSLLNEIQIQILPILIAYYEKTGQNQAAIARLFEYRDLLSFASDYQRVTAQIKQLVEKEIKYLLRAHHPEKLTRFYEKLLSIEPDNYALQMKFAEFEYNNRHYENASRLLNVLVYHPEFTRQASKLLERIQRQLNQQEFDDILVALDKRGEQYIVNAMINDLEPVKLLIDTGASMTILSPEIIHSLDIDEENAEQRIRFSTANGIVTASVVHIDKIGIQHYSVADVQVGVLPSFPMGNVDGLLGMNFLGQFVFFIDQENSTLQLTPTEEH